MIAKLKYYLKYCTNNISTIIKYMNSDQYIFIDGYPHTKNFGDALNIPIVEYLSGKKVLPSKNVSRFLFGVFRFKNYAVIGSILQWCKKNSIVWGAGYIDDVKSTIKPSKVMAVRGPKSREVCLKNNIECPEIYGDPALLLPLMYNPLVSKKYKLGIIPHYSDFSDPWVKEITKNQDVLIIDLMVFSDYKKIVNQILQCEKILSSSLHGVIISDAYGIPNRQITLSDKIIGGNFKFSDYFLSVNRDMVMPFSPKIEKIENVVYNESITIDLSKLIKACPFIKKDILDDFLYQLDGNPNFSHLKADS